MRPDDVELPRQRPGPLHRNTNAVGGRRARLSGKRDHGGKRKTQRAKQVQTMPYPVPDENAGPGRGDGANRRSFGSTSAKARAMMPLPRRPRRSGEQQQN